MNHPFTPKYIAMAKVAEEIQTMRLHPCESLIQTTYEPGDWYLRVKDDPLSRQTNFEQVCFTENGGIQAYPELKYYWLPEARQLNWMVFLKAPGSLPVATDPEVALADVMRILYGKTWRDGRWLKL